MTQFISIESLRSLETEPDCDTAYLVTQTDSVQSLFLAYSVKRDFLSVPMTYSVIRFDCEDVLETHQMGIDEYLDGFEEEVTIPAPGFYKFEANDDGMEPEDTLDLDILVLVSRVSVLEITFQTMEVMSDLYHCADAKSALLRAIG